MNRETASNISYQSNNWFPPQSANNENESIRNVYVYVLSMISIIYHITLSLGHASRLDTAEELTEQLGRLGESTRLKPGEGAR